MAKVSPSELLETFREMTLPELADFVEEFRETFMPQADEDDDSPEPAGVAA
jgi:hypothetical protein